LGDFLSVVCIAHFIFFFFSGLTGSVFVDLFAKVCLSDVVALLSKLLIDDLLLPLGGGVLANEFDEDDVEGECLVMALLKLMLVV
jgi:hypothetical protein